MRSFGYGRSSLTGIVTYGAFTPELEDEDLDRLGAPEDWGILPAHRMGTTLRKVGRRLLIRSGDSYEREMTTARAKEMLHALYRNRFPHLRNEALEHIWGGYTAVTHNEAYLFGEMDPGVFVSAGCGGAGVVRGTIQGRLLADLAHGQGSDLLQDRLAAAKPRWLPPEPFRGLGAIAQIRYEQWFAGAER